MSEREKWFKKKKMGYSAVKRSIFTEQKSEG